MFNRMQAYRDKSVYPSRYLRTIVALYQPWFDRGAAANLSRGERSEFDCAVAVLAQRDCFEGRKGSK